VAKLGDKLAEPHLSEVNLVIERLGGVLAAAKLLRCKHPAVCLWRYQDIPGVRVMYLQAVRPDALVGTRYEAVTEAA
jgi:hypothetical protein